MGSTFSQNTQPVIVKYVSASFGGVRAGSAPQAASNAVVRQMAGMRMDAP